MALSEGDKAECKELAREIVKEALVEHMKACPHGQSLNVLKAKIFGVCIGVGLASGGTVFGLAKLFGA